MDPQGPGRKRVELAACFLLRPQMFLLDTHSFQSLDSRGPCWTSCLNFVISCLGCFLFLGLTFAAGSGATEEGLTSRGGRNLSLPLRFGLHPQGPCRVGTSRGSPLLLQGSSRPRDQTRISYVAGGFSTTETLGKPSSLTYFQIAHQAPLFMEFPRQEY